MNPASAINQLRMGPKIAASFAVAIAIALTIGLVSLASARSIGGWLDVVAEARFPAAQALAAADAAHLRISRGVDVLMLPRLDPATRKAARGEIEDGTRDLDAAWRKFDALPRDPDVDRDFKATSAPWDAWRRSTQELLTAIDAHDRALVASGADSPEEIASDRAVWQAFRRARADDVPAAQSLAKLVDDVEADVATARRSAARAGAIGATVITVSILGGGAVLVALALLLSRSIGRTIRGLKSEARKITGAVAAGELDVRADPSVVDDEFRGIVEGMNEAVDACVRSYRQAHRFIQQFSMGELPEVSSERATGEYELFREDMQRLLASMALRNQELDKLLDAATRGELSVRADPTRHAGYNGKLIAKINELLDSVVRPLGVAARYVDRISKGDLPPRISDEYRGEFRVLRDNLNTCIDAVSGLVGEMTRVSAEHEAGEIDAAVDARRFHGAYRAMATGINAMVGSHVAMTRKTLGVFAEFGRGDFEARLEQLPGKKRLVNDTVEQVRANLKALISDVDTLAQAAIDGRLAVRVDAGRHAGDFRKIVDGVNRTLDAVLAPVHEAAKVLGQLAERDLCARVAGRYHGDHARLAESVNATAEALDDALAQVAATAAQVSSAAAQIASSSQAVASGANQQAASLEETSASIETVSGMARQSADNAQQADALVASARGAAGEGAAAVEQMQGAMAKIRASAESTSQIIKDVSEIAFQTNLLALNAAVEAARAGEAGRGFAVVAEEVRSLALRAKEAASKTEELIRDSVRQAGEGETTSRHVAQKLDEIVGSIGKVSAIVTEIAGAAREQSSGVTHLTRAVDEMNHVTQQNAASAEESSSASGELSSQAEELAAMVGAFRLTAGGTRAPAPRAPAHNGVRRKGVHAER